MDPRPRSPREARGAEAVRTFAVTNQKGGSCKTTTAVNLAAAIGEKEKRVLLVDLDPQASASKWLGVKDGGRGLLDVLEGTGNLADLVVKTETPGVELLPSSKWLSGAEKVLAAQAGAELALSRAFRKSLARGPWDFVFIDCPPSLGLLAVSALTTAREVLVPVEVSSLALDGLVSLMETVELVRDRLNPDLEVSAILACRVDVRTNLAQEVVERLRERFGRSMLRTVVRENVRLKEAPSFHKPITLYDTRSSGAEDYRAAAAELLRRTS